MLVTSPQSLLKVKRQGRAVQLDWASSESAALQYVHFNYRQSNLSTPPHPGSLSTRYGLSSFKRNLLRTSKAPGRQTSVPELTAAKIKLHDRARYAHAPLLKVWRTRVSRCHSPTAGTFLLLYMWNQFTIGTDTVKCCTSYSRTINNPIIYNIVKCSKAFWHFVNFLFYYFTTVHGYFYLNKYLFCPHTSTTYTELDYGLAALESACPGSVGWLWDQEVMGSSVDPSPLLKHTWGRHWTSRCSCCVNIHL